MPTKGVKRRPARDRRAARFPARALGLALAFLAAGASDALAAGSITSGAATFTRTASAFDASPEANFMGVGAGDQLFETGWWFRVAGDTQETFFPAPTTESYTGNVSTITWADVGGRGLFRAQEVSRVTDTTASGNVRMVMSLTNLSSTAPLNLSLFNMTDLDVNGSAAGDRATLVQSPFHLRISDTAAGFAQLVGLGADAFSVLPFSAATDVAAQLTNATVTDFANTGLPFGPNDFTGGLQWNATIPPAATRSFQLLIVANREDIPATSTQTSVQSSGSPSVAGGEVTFTARVASPVEGQPVGSVQFLLDGNPVGAPVALAPDGTAQLPATLTPGSHSVTAQYGGSSLHSASSSSALIQVVDKRAAIATVASSPNPSPQGSAVTFTATIASASGGPTPTGTVQFRDGAAGLGAPVALNGSGTAALTTSALGAGPHGITAVYSGDAGFAGATSAALIQAVSAPTGQPRRPPASCRGKTRVNVLLRSGSSRKPGLRVRGSLTGAKIKRVRLTGPAGFRALKPRHRGNRIDVDLRGLKKGRYVLKVEVRLRGKTQTLSRTYRVCGG